MLLTKPFTLQTQQVHGSSKLPLVPGHFISRCRSGAMATRWTHRPGPGQRLPPALLVPALEGKKPIPRDLTSCFCEAHTEREGQARWGF